jgi:hypothetical protein
MSRVLCFQRMKTLLDLEMCERCYVCRDVKFVAEIVLVLLLGSRLY